MIFMRSVQKQAAGTTWPKATKAMCFFENGLIRPQGHPES